MKHFTFLLSYLISKSLDLSGGCLESSSLAQHPIFGVNVVGHITFQVTTFHIPSVRILGAPGMGPHVL